MIEVTNIIEKDILKKFNSLGIQHIFMPRIQKINIGGKTVTKKYGKFNSSLFFCNGVPFNFDTVSTVFDDKYIQGFESKQLKELLNNFEKVEEVYNYISDAMLKMYEKSSDFNFYFKNPNNKIAYTKLKKDEQESKKNFDYTQESIDYFLQVFREQDMAYDINDNNLLYELTYITKEKIDFFLNSSFDTLKDSYRSFKIIIDTIVLSKYIKEEEDFLLKKRIKKIIINSYAGRVVIGEGCLCADKIYCSFNTRTKQISIELNNFIDEIEKELLRLIQRDKHLFSQLNNNNTIFSVEKSYREFLYNKFKKPIISI